MTITPRRIALGLISLLMLAALLVTLGSLTTGTNTSFIFVDILAMALFSALLWATWRGWVYSPYALIIVVILLASGTISEPFLTQQLSGTLIIPAIIALVLAGPRWILGSAIGTLVIVLIRAGWQGVYTEPLVLTIYGVSVGGLMLGRLVATSAMEMTARAQAAAEAAAAALQAANASLEQRVAERTAEVQSALREVEARAVEQARLLAENREQRNVLREMSVPVLPLSTEVLVMPLIGALDSERLRQVQQQALERIEHSSAKYLILDITGVTIIDTQVAKGLIQVVQAAGLLGTEVILVGIRPEVAQTIIGLGIQLEGMTTRSNLQEGIAYTLLNG